MWVRIPLLSIKLGTIDTVIKNALIRLSIQLSNACCQCYNGGKSIFGISNGVSNKILSGNSKAFFTHCFEHVLNLAVGYIVKNVWFSKDSIYTTHEISNLI